MAGRTRHHLARAGMTSARSLAGAVVVLVSFALVAAACGGNGSKVASASSAGSLPTSATPTTATVVKMANARYGSILTNGKGFALYTYTADKAGKTGCTGVCLKFWPPLLLPADVIAPIAGPGVSGLGTFSRPEGTQVTYQGQPLYTYVTDTKAGQTTGQNVLDNGGTWLLAVLGTAPAASSTTALPATSTPATNGAVAAPPATGTQSSGTQSPRTQSPGTSRPPTRAPVTLPPVTLPPVTHPPVTEPPVTSPPPTPAPTTPPTSPPTTAPGGGGVSY